MNKISNLQKQTIIAQCTPPGKGALALLRICGDNVRTIVEKITNLPETKKITLVPTHTIHYGSIIDKEGQLIDKVLFFIMDAPHTFTGENTIEITCHNNPFIIDTIIQQVVDQGARIANPGEFTQRALLHDKIDLTQAEAINELIQANTQMTLKKALAQMEGSLSEWIHSIEQQLITCLALSEASFEFLDEENVEFGNQIMTTVHTILETINHLKKTFDMQQHIRQGIRIAIIGVVNAGKSSLFNALIGKERSIVTHIAGTTRDSIEAGLYKNGNYWTLIDTAGLRSTNDIIEQEGIRRSLEEAKGADVVLLVQDALRELTAPEKKTYAQLTHQYSNKIIPITSKIDLIDTNALSSVDGLSFSTKFPNFLTPIEEAIQNKIELLLSLADSPFLFNQRQLNVLVDLEKNLLDLLPLFSHQPIAYELVSIHINQLLAHFAQLTGKSISEAGMDAIFRHFCVGK